ncbi:hypothetical protein RRG08_015132 [Elysia crispata]|uniref:Uncharacterized protein n=1 Tax=Elysia crispata TaxID=231223 RepID=A0AAE1DNN5_9GAST|nr:hypothetical protein RRG08_015132 [Elysia crispata]
MSPTKDALCYTSRIADQSGACVVVQTSTLVKWTTRAHALGNMISIGIYITPCESSNRGGGAKVSKHVTGQRSYFVRRSRVYSGIGLQLSWKKEIQGLSMRCDYKYTSERKILVGGYLKILRIYNS